MKTETYEARQALIEDIRARTGLARAVIRVALAWRRKRGDEFDPKGLVGLVEFKSRDNSDLTIPARAAQAALAIGYSTGQGDGYFYETGYASLKGPRGDYLLGTWENA